MPTRLTHDLLQVLRTIKAELKERAKMLRYYGLSAIALNNFHPLRLFSNDDLPGRMEKKEGKVYGNQVSGNLQNEINRIRELNEIQKNLFIKPPSITFISYAIPRINSTSSDFRLFHILKILLQNNCRINFLYCTKLFNDAEYIKSFKGNIEFNHIPLKNDDYENFIAALSPEYVWITELWRMSYTRSMAELSSRLKTSCPSSVLIVDTVDFHYKEFYRKYELTNDNDDLKRANEFLEYEKILYRAANVVVVISDDEKSDIEMKISGIKRIEVVPNIHEIQLDSRPLRDRKHICFVGHFGNKHNVDAVKLFIRDIWPYILCKKSNG